MSSINKLFSLSAFLILLAAFPAAAQTTGGVFGPGVSAGDRTLEYRAAFAPVDGSDDVRFVHRLHYQHALNESWRLRGVLQGSDVETGRQEFNFFQAELQWQFLEKNERGLVSALRLDGRITEGDDGPDLIGLNWTTDWNIDADWRIRGVLLVGKQIGEGRLGGVNLETRTSLTYRADENLRIGIESFNFYGNTSAGLGSFKDQRHQLGPSASLTLGNRWSLFGGILFGLSNPAPDTDYRLWITKSF